MKYNNCLKHLTNINYYIIIRIRKKELELRKEDITKEEKYLSSSK